jgi:hypothetical protein
MSRNISFKRESENLKKKKQKKKSINHPRSANGWLHHVSAELMMSE